MSAAPLVHKPHKLRDKAWPSNTMTYLAFIALYRLIFCPKVPNKANMAVTERAWAPMK